MQNKIVYYMEEIAKVKRGLFVPPVTCEIDPSNKCPLDCGFCMFAGSNHDSQEDLPWDIYSALIMQLKSLEVKSITFTGGGEPVMNKHFNHMVDFALSMGFEIGLVTNGVLLDKVKRKNDFKFIRVSINAGTAKDYKKVCGVDAFNVVLDNTRQAIAEGAFVGWSFVVCPDNVDSVHEAQAVAKDIGVKYIQFKPAIIDNKPFVEYCVRGDNTIDTRRFTAGDNLPCAIAHLIGIVGADANLYYCCQKRGNKRFYLGSLREESFKTIWERRLSMWPDVNKCPNCRYMNYAKAYEELLLEKDIFFDHKNFL